MFLWLENQYFRLQKLENGIKSKEIKIRDIIANLFLPIFETTYFKNNHHLKNLFQKTLIRVKYSLHKTVKLISMSNKK